MKKRGVTVQTTIISIIILIITAAILFYFFRYLPYKEIIDKEACRHSVILRDNMFLKGEFGLEIPLNCKTREIVIESTNPEFIKREIANAMYDCWWMLGEGKRNFFMRTPEIGRSYCVICSTIEFDEKVQKKLPEIRGLNAYLFDTIIPKKNITYWDYMTGGQAPLKELPKVGEESLDTTREYAIVYALVEKSTLAAALGGGAAMGTLGGAIGGVIGTIALPGVGTIAGIAIGKAVGAAVGTTVGVGVGWKAGDLLDDALRKEGYKVMFALIPLEAEAIKTFGCTSIESIP